MPTDAEYLAWIQGFDADALLALWADLTGAAEPGTPALPAWVQPGKAFEYVVIRAFELGGADVRWPYSVKFPWSPPETSSAQDMEQIDGVVYVGGVSCLIESKHWGRNVNVDPIAKLRNQLGRRPAGTIGAVFSFLGFTPAARLLAQFASPQTILLWTGEEIDHAIRHRAMVRGLLVKLRKAVEEGVPDYDLRWEEQR